MFTSTPEQDARERDPRPGPGPGPGPAEPALDPKPGNRSTSLVETLRAMPDVQGVIVSAKNEVSISSGLRGRLTVLAPPTDAP